MKEKLNPEQDKKPEEQKQQQQKEYIESPWKFVGFADKLVKKSNGYLY